MTKALILTGDENIPALPLKESEVNHMRRLLAWLRCEYMLDPHMQQGFIEAAAWGIEDNPAKAEQINEIVEQQAAEINKCPAYVRQAVKMLTKAIRDHEKSSGIIDSSGQA